MMSDSFDWLNEDSRTFLDRGYLVGDTTAEERVRDIADNAEDILGIEGFADKFYKYMSRGYYSLASPVWANFGLDRGMPISCFGSYIEDNMESILYTHAEVGMMTKLGGGTSGYFGDIRPRGSKITNNGETNGTHPFASLFDQVINVVSQGETRRGHFAGYIDVEHDDIEEWLQIQNEGDDIQTMMWGVVIGDKWMRDMVGGDEEKRELWAKIIENRMNLGIPYIMFRGNANGNKPKVYKDKGYDIHASNLCSEIMLSSGPKESFVCCLSSMNAAEYDSWKSTDAVETLTRFLDAVMQEFIDGTEDVEFMDRAVQFAKQHRALGIGILGWHSYLQQNMIPFESAEATMKGTEITKTIKERSYKASEEMGERFGPAPVMEGRDDARRNTTTMAVAPTKSSSFILGQVSPSIEPIKSNYYVRDRAKIKVTYKNPQLKSVLQAKGEDNGDTWERIALRDGSVQHLDCLSEKEKNVFKTFSEISQKAIIDQAASRQRHIDQAQSLNLAIDPNTVPAKDVNQLYIQAWKKGLKTLYYQNSVNSAQKFSRNILECRSCEG